MTYDLSRIRSSPPAGCRKIAGCRLQPGVGALRLGANPLPTGSQRLRMPIASCSRETLLFTLWYGMPHRPTRDADLCSASGRATSESIAQTFRDIAGVKVEDGIIFDPATVSVEEIRKDAEGYAGARASITASGPGLVARRRSTSGSCAVTPGPVDAVYPVLIEDLPAPRLRT